MAGLSSWIWAAAAAFPVLLPMGPAPASGPEGMDPVAVCPEQTADGLGRGCTVFYAADEQMALAGNNEDAINPYTYVWFVPGEAGEYGRVYFGFEDGIPQGGVNEAGLFYDGLALPYKPLPTTDLRPVYEGTMLRGDLSDKIMAEAGTVAEALAILDTYRHYGMDTYQLFYGDAAGDSAIVEGDAVLPGEGSFQIATNFRLSEHPNPPYPCRRYQTARGRLFAADNYTVDLFRDILEETHQEPPGPTLYSTIYDLRNRLIYVYLYHDFENAVVLDMATELSEGFHYYRLSSLFPANSQASGYELGYPGPTQAELSDRTVPMEPGQLDEYAGPYRVRLGVPGETVNVCLDDGRLLLHQRSSLPIELWPEGEDRFFHVFHEGNELTITFERGEDGVVAVATGRLLGEWFRLERVVDASTDGSSATFLPWWGWVLVVAGCLCVGTAALVHRRVRR